VPSGQKALLVVTFSAVSSCGGAAGVFCFVRVLADNNVLPPGDVVFRSEAFGFGAQSMQFIAGSVAAGAHTIKVQWRVDSAASNIYVWGRTLTVLRSMV
jgi:hypothetical protein